MKLPHRRKFLHLVAGAAALPAMSRIALAETYPSRPVRIIVGYPPGGATDAMARLIAQQLSERLGQPFVVDNRPGAGSNIATEAVVTSQPDGYTLLLTFSANAINATFYDKLNFNFIRDIAPIASIARSPFVMEVHPSVPAKTVPEFIAYAKINPGKIRMASNGNGTTGHVAGELFKSMAGVDMVHVPYRGPEPALTDLLAGKVQVRFGIPVKSIEYIKTGKLPVLAVTTAARLEILPDIPAMREFVPGYEASAFFGIGAPRNTPAAIVDKLNKEINAGLVDPKLKAKLTELVGHGACGLTRRIRQAHRWRDREVGQGDQVCGRQGGLIADRARHSVTSDLRMAAITWTFGNSTDVRWMAAFGGDPDIEPTSPHGRVRPWLCKNSYGQDPQQTYCRAASRGTSDSTHGTLCGRCPQKWGASLCTSENNFRASTGARGGIHHS